MYKRQVSIRAPISRRTKPADEFAKLYGGGGRAEAAGIDHLRDDEIDTFITAFQAAFG